MQPRATYLLSNADIKALRATPKTLVPAPGANKRLEFLSAVVMSKAGTNVLGEATANLAVRYEDAANDALLKVKVAYRVHTF